MRAKPSDVFLLVGFLLIVGIPLLGVVFSPAQYLSGNYPSQSNFSIKQVLKTYLHILPDTSDYFDDHYLFHVNHVDLLQKIRYHLLHESVFPNVIIGKEDWLFYTGEDNISDYQCSSPFTAGEVQTIRQRLLGWQSRLAERNIQFYVVVAPNKETIYPQYLPDAIQPLPNACRIDLVMQSFQTTPQLAVLDLRADLQAAAQTGQVYHRTDTHWNDAGALVAARAILLRLSREFPALSMPSIENCKKEMQFFSGDLAAFLPSTAQFMEEKMILVPISAPAPVIEDGGEHGIRSRLPGSSLPSAVIFRDSFSDALIPFLSGHFSQVLYVHSFSLDFDLIEREKPDIVIFEIAQRYLTTLR